MNNKILDILIEIRDQYGDMIFYNHQKTKNIMHDLAPGMHKERIHIGQFLELNGYFQLKYAGHSFPIIRARLTQSYVSTYAVNDSVAIWVLDIFSELLGYSDFENIDKMLKQDEPYTGIDIREDMISTDHTSQTAASSKSDSPSKPPRIPTPKEMLKAHFPEEIKATNSPLPEEIKVASPPLPEEVGAASPPVTGSLPGSASVDIDLSKRIATDMHTVAVMPDGTVRAVGPNDDGQCGVNKWRDIIAISAGPHFTVGLMKNGRVIACGRNEYGQCNVFWWSDIVAISAGARHTVGLKSDGTVVATGQNRNGECNTGKWRNITYISAGYLCTFGIKSDASLLIKGNIKGTGLKPLSNVSDVVNPYLYRTLVLKRNGRLDVIGHEDTLQNSIRKWRNVKQISAGPDYFAGLFKDGTVRVLAYYWPASGIECSPDSWSGIAAISAGRFHLLGVKNDGTIEAVMMHPSRNMNKGQCRVGDWRLI